MYWLRHSTGISFEKLKIKQKLRGLVRERTKLEKFLKKTQHDYLVKGKLSRDDFIAKFKPHKDRMAEIKHEEKILSKKLKS